MGIKGWRTIIPCAASQLFQPGRIPCWIFCRTRLYKIAAKITAGRNFIGPGTTRSPLQSIESLPAFSHLSSLEFSKRGNSQNLVQENIFRLSLGFALSDLWFIKRRYD